ncbi:MAG: hypothetical protein ACU0BF_13360 [Paracoccaceae bacterium]
MHGPLNAAPDYTVAALVSMGVVLFMALTALHVALGFVWALVVAWAVDRALRARRARR